MVDTVSCECNCNKLWVFRADQYTSGQQFEYELIGYT